MIYNIHQLKIKNGSVDIDIETLNYDLTQLESAISNKTSKKYSSFFLLLFKQFLIFYPFLANDKISIQRF